MLMRQLIGRALRRARLTQGRTLREVATAARVSLPYLSELERGRKEASSEVLAAICRALDLHLRDLLDEVSHDLALLEPAGLPGVSALPGRILGFGAHQRPPAHRPAGCGQANRLDGQCRAGRPYRVHVARPEMGRVPPDHQGAGWAPYAVGFPVNTWR